MSSGMTARRCRRFAGYWTTRRWTRRGGVGADREGMSRRGDDAMTKGRKCRATLGARSRSVSSGEPDSDSIRPVTECPWAAGRERTRPRRGVRRVPPARRRGGARPGPSRAPRGGTARARRPAAPAGGSRGRGEVVSRGGRPAAVHTPVQRVHGRCVVPRAVQTDPQRVPVVGLSGVEFHRAAGQPHAASRVADGGVRLDQTPRDHVQPLRAVPDRLGQLLQRLLNLLSAAQPCPRLSRNSHDVRVVGAQPRSRSVSSAATAHKPGRAAARYRPRAMIGRSGAATAAAVKWSKAAALSCCSSASGRVRSAAPGGRARVRRENRPQPVPLGRHQAARARRPVSGCSMNGRTTFRPSAAGRDSYSQSRPRSASSAAEGGQIPHDGRLFRTSPPPDIGRPGRTPGARASVRCRGPAVTTSGRRSVASSNRTLPSSADGQ